MFIEKEELKSAIYHYQVEEITEADDDIVFMAMAAAEDEVKSYLKANNMKAWKDGRALYDATAIFAMTGTARNALILQHTKTIAVWNLVQLCNVDILFDQVKERYDRAITWLKQLNRGEITIDLPLLPNTDATTSTDVQPFRFNSRPKFNHE